MSPCVTAKKEAIRQFNENQDEYLPKQQSIGQKIRTGLICFGSDGSPPGHLPGIYLETMQTGEELT